MHRTQLEKGSRRTPRKQKLCGNSAIATGTWREKIMGGLAASGAQYSRYWVCRGKGKKLSGAGDLVQHWTFGIKGNGASSRPGSPGSTIEKEWHHNKLREHMTREVGRIV